MVIASPACDSPVVTSRSAASPSHPSSEATVVHLYGPVGVECNGVSHHVGGPRERAVLAALVLSAEHPVSVDRLTYWLWGDDPPSTARKSLQNAVVRLRRTTESLGLTIDTLGQAYRLRMGSARVGDAVADEPLLHIGDTPAVLSARAQLSEVRLTTIERQLAQRLDVDAAGAVPELEHLVGEHTLRESLWALLIRANYRAGRQGDALQAFSRARIALRDGLGVDPGPELMGLHARVLAHDSGLAADPSSTARAWLANGVAQAQLGDVASAQACLHAAVDAARAALAMTPSEENLCLLADAAAELAGEAEWIVGDAAIEALLEDVLARLGEPPKDRIRAGRIETALALLRGIRSDARAKVHAARALELTLDAEPDRRTAALWAWATVWEGPDDVDARARNGEALIEHGEAHHEPVAIALGHHYAGWAALERGDATVAAQHNAVCLEAAATSAHPHLAAQAADTRFVAALLTGDFPRAGDLADELGAAWRRSADPGTAFLVEVSARLLLGELSTGIDDLLPHFQVIRDAMPGEVMWRLAEALAHALAGRTTEAANVMAGITTSELRGIPRTTTWTGNASGIAHIADLLNRSDLAVIALDHLKPIAGGQIVCGGFAYRGSTAHWMGVCLHATGQLALAEAALGQALSEHAALGSTPWLAQSAFGLARVLADQPGRDRRAEARRQLDVASTLATQLGMVPLLRRIGGVTI
jgi:DNA-binding SARP family transcriptional activator